MTVPLAAGRKDCGDFIGIGILQPPPAELYPLGFCPAQACHDAFADQARRVPIRR
jgi:hypothetical protein